MSKLNAKEFLKKILRDEDLAKKCENLSDSDEAANLAKDEGYECTKEDLDAARNEMQEEEGENIAVRLMNRCMFKGSC